jgi:hypothetical protein
MDNTTRCGSPAMKGTQYCYSHHRELARAARRIAERVRQRWFESAPLKDAASVQRALMQVMTRLVSGDIDHKQAGQILHKLQTASLNFDHEFPRESEAREARPQKEKRKKKRGLRILVANPEVSWH